MTADRNFDRFAYSPTYGILFQADTVWMTIWFSELKKNVINFFLHCIFQKISRNCISKNVEVAIYSLGLKRL